MFDKLFRLLSLFRLSDRQGYPMSLPKRVTLIQKNSECGNAESDQIHRIDLSTYFWLKNCLEIHFLGSLHSLLKLPVFLCSPGLLFPCHINADVWSQQLSPAQTLGVQPLRKLGSPRGKLQQEKWWKKQPETLDSKKMITYESHPTALSRSLTVTNN